MRKDAEEFLREKSQKADKIFDRLGIAEFDLNLGLDDDVIRLEVGGRKVAKSGRVRHTSGHGAFLKSESSYDGRSGRPTLKIPRRRKPDPQKSK